MPKLKENIDFPLEVTLAFVSPFLKLLFRNHFDGKFGAGVPLELPFVYVGKRPLTQELVHQHYVGLALFPWDFLSLRGGDG